MLSALAVAAVVAAQDGSEAYDTSDAYAPEEDYGQNVAASYEPMPTYDRYSGKYESVTTCFTGCPPGAPCWDPQTSKCSPKVGAVSFVTASQGYTAQQTYDGDTQQETYRRLSKGGCPAGTKDSLKMTVEHKWIFWIGFGLLFLPALLYISASFQKVENVKHGNTQELISLLGLDAAQERWADVVEARLIAGLVCLIASLAYLTMATVGGYWTKCDGRDFYYARYVDWLITTPLMLYDIARLAGASKFNTMYLVSLDVLMILSGLIGALNEHGNDKWAFFAFSMLTFIGVCSVLWTLSVTKGVLGSFPQNPAEHIFQRARTLTLGIWIGYPVIWILAEGTGVISVFGESVAYTILDIIAKSLLGYLIVSQVWGFSTKLTVQNTGGLGLDGDYEMKTSRKWTSGGKTITWVSHPRNGDVWVMSAIGQGAATLYNARATIDPPSFGWFEGGDTEDALIRQEHIISYTN